MPNLPLTALGASATQNQTSFTFVKNDYADTGLNVPEGGTTPVPKAINSATSLLVAILEKGEQNFTPAAQTADPAINMTITKQDFQGSATVNGQPFEVITYLVSVRRPRRSIALDPDDFDT